MIAAVNEASLRATGRSRQELVGRHVFEAFPDNPADPDADGMSDLGVSLGRLLATGQADTMPAQRYGIPVVTQPGVSEERRWSPVNTPVNGPGGRVAWIIHRVEDSTALMRSRRFHHHDQGQPGQRRDGGRSVGAGAGAATCERGAADGAHPGGEVAVIRLLDVLPPAIASRRPRHGGPLRHRDVEQRGARYPPGAILMPMHPALGRADRTSCGDPALRRGISSRASLAEGPDHVTPGPRAQRPMDEQAGPHRPRCQGRSPPGELNMSANGPSKRAPHTKSRSRPGTEAVSNIRGRTSVALLRSTAEPPPSGLRIWRRRAQRVQGAVRRSGADHGTAGRSGRLPSGLARGDRASIGLSLGRARSGTAPEQ
ncbi:hypothetical protein ACFXG6_25550 [Streptomyces roseus]|uniref:hypothetical protein n=1 Tax=Streptomyces roseus TaxID=66430 RepID=UPI003696BB83